MLTPPSIEKLLPRYALLPHWEQQGPNQWPVTLNGQEV
jgi:hypothetical protein